MIELAQALVDSGVMEARQVGYELIETHPSALDEITREQVEALGSGSAGGLDNWGSVDDFACSVAGRAWRRGRLSRTRLSRCIARPSQGARHARPGRRSGTEGA